MGVASGDVTGGNDGSAERDEGVDQLLELLVVKGLIGREGDAVGAILDVVSDRPALSREVAVAIEQSAVGESQ